MTYLQEIEVAKHQSEQICHEPKAYRETEKCRLLSHSTPLAYQVINWLSTPTFKRMKKAFLLSPICLGWKYPVSPSREAAAMK
jgi:hypothetical protein